MFFVYDNGSKKKSIIDTTNERNPATYTIWYY